MAQALRQVTVKAEKQPTSEVSESEPQHRNRGFIQARAGFWLFGSFSRVCSSVRFSGSLLPHSIFLQAAESPSGGFRCASVPWEQGSPPPPVPGGVRAVPAPEGPAPLPSPRRRRSSGAGGAAHHALAAHGQPGEARAAAGGRVVHSTVPVKRGRFPTRYVTIKKSRAWDSQKGVCRQHGHRSTWPDSLCLGFIIHYKMRGFHTLLNRLSAAS